MAGKPEVLASLLSMPWITSEVVRPNPFIATQQSQEPHRQESGVCATICGNHHAIESGAGVSANRVVSPDDRTLSDESAMRSSFVSLLTCQILIVLCATVVAQQPTIEVTVRKTPGGKGTVTAYDPIQKQLTVELTMPNGRPTQVTVSRQHVSPATWRTITALFDTTAREVNRVETSASAGSSGGIGTAELQRGPINIETTFGDEGTFVSYDVDTEKVQLDFQGRRGHPLSIGQLKPKSWKAARQKIAARLMTQ